MLRLCSFFCIPTSSSLSNPTQKFEVAYNILSYARRHTIVQSFKKLRNDAGKTDFRLRRLQFFLGSYGGPLGSRQPFWMT